MTVSNTNAMNAMNNGCAPCPGFVSKSMDEVILNLLESIAMQENALSHILCAESQKMQTAMEMDGLDLCKLLEINDSATNMVHAVANLELALKDKLEFVTNNFCYSSCGDDDDHDDC